MPFPITDVLDKEGCYHYVMMKGQAPIKSRSQVEGTPRFAIPSTRGPVTTTVMESVKGMAPRWKRFGPACVTSSASFVGGDKTFLARYAAIFELRTWMFPRFTYIPT